MDPADGGGVRPLPGGRLAGSLVQDAVPRAYSAVALCLYDIDRFGGNVNIPALRVHPKMLFAGMLLENPYFVDPDEG